MDEIAFKVQCFHFNKRIRTTREYWQKITDEKHPSIKERENHVIETLQSPDEIRQSKKHENIFLYYKWFNEKYICAVVKFMNGDGFIVTAYHTAKVKEGRLVWKR